MSDARDDVREQELREEYGEQGPIVRDKRRVDPETGAVREPADKPASSAPAGDEAAADQSEGGEPAEQSEDVVSLQARLDDAVADIKRVQAEYANYRKRVDRDRAAVREQALANVLADLLPVLDDIGRAREHGELEGGFRQVAELLEQIVTKLGLVRFGEVGDPFDPTVHEALMHSYSSDAVETMCAQVLQPGYSLNERVLRPARVAVVEPEPGPAGGQSGSQEAPSDSAGEQVDGAETQADTAAGASSDRDRDGA